MEHIFNDYSIQGYSVANGDECTYVLPRYCDIAQQYLVSGFGWRPSPTTLTRGLGGYLYAPIMLPPWTECIEVMMRGFYTYDEEPSVTLVLRDSDNTSTISIQDVTVSGAFPKAGTPPATMEEVFSYSWSGGGNIGQGTPDGNATVLQVTPSNAYVCGFIRLEPGDFLSIHELAYVCRPSSAGMS